MTEKIVVNTSPILALSKMWAFEAIGKLPFEFVCPVVRPFIEKAKNAGIYYDDALIETFLKSLSE